VKDLTTLSEVDTGALWFIDMLDDDCLFNEGTNGSCNSDTIALFVVPKYVSISCVSGA